MLESVNQRATGQGSLYLTPLTLLSFELLRPLSFSEVRRSWNPLWLQNPTKHRGNSWYDYPASCAAPGHIHSAN